VNDYTAAELSSMPREKLEAVYWDALEEVLAAQAARSTPPCARKRRSVASATGG
jgi:hypothetical protein